MGVLMFGQFSVGTHWVGFEKNVSCFVTLGSASFLQLLQFHRRIGHV
jgi:hypothetical protein